MVEDGSQGKPRSEERIQGMSAAGILRQMMRNQMASLGSVECRKPPQSFLRQFLVGTFRGEF